MKLRIKKILHIAAFSVLTSMLGMVTTGFATELETITSSAQSVTVKVTPKNIASSAKIWDFAIVLETHSANLGDDLMKAAVLLDGTGGRMVPINWIGAPPDGHHRSGTLQFKAVSPMPAVLELQISREGEAKPRSFRWPMK